MQVEVISNLATAAQLRPEWESLLGEAVEPSVFLTPEWLLAWWDAYGGGLDMHLVAVRAGRRLVGLFPLASTGGLLQGWSNEYTDRFGPIVAADGREAVEAAARHLVNQAPRWTRLGLMPVSTGSPVIDWLCDALDAVGAGHRRVPWFRSPIIDLPGTPDEMRSRLSGSFRATLARKERSASDLGWRSEILTDAGAVSEVFEVSAETWAHREGTAIGSTPENRRFYRGLAEAAAERGWLRIALLREAGGRAIAYELNLVRRGAAVNLKLGYRESVGDGSPGLVLRAGVIDALIAEAAHSFDLLGQDEAYKMHWTDRTIDHIRLTAFPPTPAGRARHIYRHRIRPSVARLVDSVRPASGELG